MNKINIKNTNLNLSELCLGTAYWGTKISSNNCEQILDRFIDFGGNFIDTALIYADWHEGKSESEKVIGRILKKKKIIISTKGFINCENGINQIEFDLNQSIKNLNQECIDIYYLHKDHTKYSVELIIDKLIEQKKKGKILHFGLSNWTYERFKLAYEYALNTYNYKIQFTQLLYNIFHPNLDFINPVGIIYPNNSYRKFLINEEITCMSFSSLGSGYYNSKNKLKTEVIISAEKTYNNLQTKHIIKEISSLKNSSNLNFTQIAFGYLKAQELNIIPIFGVSNIKQLISNLDHEIPEIDENFITKIEKIKKKKYLMKKIYERFLQ